MTLDTEKLAQEIKSRFDHATQKKLLKEKFINVLIKNFFNDSTSQFASFFTTSTNLTQNELEELKKIIDVELQKKKK